MIIRRYSELRSLDTFEDRFDYLRLKGGVGHETFGFERYLNQRFYTSREWKQVRTHVIARDYGLDMGVEGHEIHGRIIIHHMNPMQPEDIVYSEDHILDPEFLISVSHMTHNAIHYGSLETVPNLLSEREPGDTRLWD